MNAWILFFFIHLDWFLRERASLANNTFRNAFDWEKDCIKFSLFLFSIPEHSFTHQRNHHHRPCQLPVHQNSPTMSDENKSPEPENVPEHICALFHQLNPEHIINGIKKTVSGDIEHLFDMARSRELNAGTIIMLFDEAMKTRTGHVTLIALAAAALVVCIVMLVYPMSVAAPFLGALGFTHAGPAAGKTTAVYFLLLVC